MPRPAASPTERGSQIGRQAGYLALGLLVSAFTAVCTVEIIRQVWFPSVASPSTDCRSGLKQLAFALQRARVAAQTKAKTPSDEGAAVAEFRQALEPEWHDRASLAASCEGDPPAARALKRIEQLRYAEEHAVRYEAQNLSRHRREVEKMLEQLGLTASNPPLPPPSTERP